MIDASRHPERNTRRVLLLHPFNVEEKYHYAVPQVALGYLSAALKKHGYTQVDVQDAHIRGWSVEDVVGHVARTRPDVLGVRLWSHQLGTVRRYLERLERVHPAMKIVVGGPHMTVAPSYVELTPGVDYGVAGEAESSLPLLLDHLFGHDVDLLKVPGLVWVEDGELKTNPILKDPDLDRYEVDWDALSLHRYHASGQRTTAYDQGRKKNAFIFVTRGCPYPCTYCAAGAMNGKQIREHSAARTVADITKLYHRHGVRHFNIMDDNFTFHKKTVVEFCEAFLQRRDELRGVTFHNPNGVRVDRLDDEMLELMQRCGWKWLHVGLESGSDRVIKLMKKRLKLDKARENITKIKAHGIKCWGFFILGYPAETEADIQETILFAVDSDLTAATFSLFSPIPGTEIYEDLLAEGRIGSDYNMASYNDARDHVFAQGVDGDGLLRLRREALLRFYCRPDRAYHLLRNMDARTIANRAKVLLISPFFRRLPIGFQNRHALAP